MPSDFAEDVRVLAEDRPIEVQPLLVDFASVLVCKLLQDLVTTGIDFSL